MLFTTFVVAKISNSSLKKNSVLNSVCVHSADEIMDCEKEELEVVRERGF